MTDLIARLEAAIEGSRELDEDIAKHIGISATVTYGDGLITEERTVPRNPRYYTTSIDAALTLEDDLKKRIKLVGDAWCRLIAYDLGIEYMPRCICIEWLERVALRARTPEETA